MPFKPVPTRVDYVQLEHDIQRFWDESDMLERYLARNQEADKRWSFIDGPITANNPMGVHHAWGRSYKDLYNRFHTMKGEKLRYQQGFDCQGLWIEVEVEKEFGFKSKKDIETYGVAEFVEACKERVRRFSKIMTDQSIRLGYWMDWDNSYYTNSDENNYTIWAFLKKVWSKGWLYKGKDTMPWCPRCGTGISQHEIVTEGYQDITHRSVYLKFPITGRVDDSPGVRLLSAVDRVLHAQERVVDPPQESLLVWTTTPWTLAANVAAAVNPELTYLRVKQNDSVFYVSRGALATAVRGEHEVLGEVLGRELVGLTYRGPFDELDVQHGVVHQVIAWNEVSDAEGTGIVHIAPGAGAEDFALSKEYGLDVIAPLEEDGTYVVGGGFGFLEGQFAGDVPQQAFDSLRDKGMLYRIQDYTHRYPTCWRCNSELVFRLVDEWFINMDGPLDGGASGAITSDNAGGETPLQAWSGVSPAKTLRDKMQETTRRAKWIPEFGLARELDWLKNMHDWMISKKRYYGLALPIYECKACSHFEVIGSEVELQERAIEGWSEFEGHSPHRPWVDAVKIACANCGAKVERIQDVGNPWLDAGIVPFSTLDYRRDPDYHSQWFPADWVSESFPGQFRNWFYALLAMGTVMALETDLDGEPPFKTLFSYALLRDEKGEEMHKSKGNAIEFIDAADKIGADIMRWLYLRCNPANNLNFGYGPGEELKRGFLSTLWNTYSFFVTYASLDGWTPSGSLPHDNLTELDRWALSELNQLVVTVTSELNEYDSMTACRQIEEFVEGLSNWYVRRSRRRFWKSESDADKQAAYETLWTCLTTLTRLMAPMVPFLAEELYQNLVRGVQTNAPDSVHLTDWPQADESLIDPKLSSSIAVLQRLASLGRSARAKANLKVRQPLSKVLIMLPVTSGTLEAEVRTLADELREELNVKGVWVMNGGLGPDGAFHVIGELNDAGQPFMDVDAFDFQVRLNLPILGQKYGQQMQELQRAFAQSDKLHLARRKLAGLPIQVATLSLQSEELLVSITGKPGYAVAEEAGYAVAVTTEITPELADEGLAREIVRHVQELRKNAGFEIADRIRLYHDGDADIARVMVSWHDYISQETLAEAVVAGTKGGAHASDEVVDGRKVRLAVERA